MSSSGATGRIAVDAMGGDLGPSEIVVAVKLAFQQFPELAAVTLVGDQAIPVAMLVMPACIAIPGSLSSTPRRSSRWRTSR